ncbi:MAG: 4-deoxy-4-formamido-L-arabinose-phosphoundecaprenol deformylase [Gammaproteobacteria bacterium]|nr:4-deoxy-4-formamido-L-arabinose-phosphoundecaprenol deformylase [Gammaproteobacteria bacterium]
MRERVHVGLKVDVDTLRGTREGVPRLAALLARERLDATFYFSVGPDHTGRALRRAFRPGFAKKVARTSVLKHYGVRTLLYGVLLPGPDIGRAAGDEMRAVRDRGFEVGLHTYDHVRWQDRVVGATPEWTRAEFARGIEAFARVFGAPPRSHAAAGWQINDTALALEREYGLAYASDTRGSEPFWPRLADESAAAARAPGACAQLPTTLPTFDELLGVDGVDESSVADAVFARSVAPDAPRLQVFTLHAELEGQRLLGAFERLLARWRDAGVAVGRVATIHALATEHALPTAPVVMRGVPGRSGLLAAPAEPLEVAA